MSDLWYYKCFSNWRPQKRLISVNIGGFRKVGILQVFAEIKLTEYKIKLHCSLKRHDQSIISIHCNNKVIIIKYKFAWHFKKSKMDWFKQFAEQKLIGITLHVSPMNVYHQSTNACQYIFIDACGHFGRWPLQRWTVFPLQTPPSSRYFWTQN